MNRTDIVLFEAGATEGRVAASHEKVEEDENTVTYMAVFEKKTPVQGPADPGDPEPQPPAEEIQKVELEPDTSPTPEGVDYAELGDLPA